jgi:hypothetical protein
MSTNRKKVPLIFFAFLLTFSLNAQNKAIVESLKANQISILEINTIGSLPITSKLNYQKAEYLFYDSKKNFSVLKDSTEIKGRGNSTWEYPKKPFRLKLYKSKTIGDLPASRHWALLANFEDKSGSRTKLASDLGLYIGIGYTPRSIPVEVVLNGEHLGSYQLIEVPKIASNRIDITEVNTKNNITSGGVIFELDLRLGEQYNFFTNAGVPITIKDPDDLNAKTPQAAQVHFNYLKNILMTAEDALFDEKFRDPNIGYAKHFNVESVIDFYLVQEILKNFDIGEYSVFKYIDTKNKNKITYGPIWDFDLSAGNREGPLGFKASVENAWFRRFFEDENFEAKVKEKWSTIREDLLSTMMYSINQNARSINASQELNTALWGYWKWGNTRTFTEDVSFLKIWLYERVQWLDNQWSDAPIKFNPVVFDQYVQTGEDVPLTIELSDSENNLVNTNFFIAVPPTKGVIEQQGNTNKFTYTPFENENGVDKFYFSSGIIGSIGLDTGRVVINISPINDKPQTKDVLDSLYEDTILERLGLEGLKKHTKDPEGDPLSFVLISPTKNGEIKLNGDGSIIYAPEKDFFGRDSFSFVAKDNEYSSDTATYSFEVIPVNDRPLTKDAMDSLDEDTKIERLGLEGLKKHATDPDGDVLSFKLIQSTRNGSLKLNQDGSFVYLPDTDYFGSDFFSFVAQDKEYASDTAIYSLQVMPINDRPVIRKDSLVYQIFTNGKIVLEDKENWKTNFSDIDNDSQDLIPVFDEGLSGAKIVNEDNKHVYYPNKNFVGVDKISYRIKDSEDFSLPGVIYIRILSEDIQSFESLNLYPNPNSGEFYIDNLYADKALIFDLNGKKIDNFSFKQVGSNLHFKVYNYQHGIHFLYLLYENRVIGFKKVLFNGMGLK